jgi:membrane fusion protein (multidrug efflux system)
MRAIYNVSAAVVILLFAVACGSTTKEEKGSLAEKKAQLEKLRADAEKLSQQIRQLEEQINLEDTTAAASMRIKLVTATTLQPQSFKHYIDLQGRVNTENIYTVTPRGMGGQVKAIYVKEGDYVKKGQLLMKLDDGTLQQQLEQAKIQLNYLQDIYNRRKNLWDQKIGTEVELITAKNNVVNQQKQIDLINEQLSYTNVLAETAGVVETVTIRVGETFSAASASMAGITIVNPSDLKVTVSIPENYLPRVKKGTPVVIEIPDLGKTFNSSISHVSQLIDNNARAFTAEAKLPVGSGIKPNIVAIVKLLDYSVQNAIVVPMRTVQSDENGKYVYVLADQGGKKVAVKKQVEVGEIYGEDIEVKAGLAAGDQLITQGYQSLYEGQLVTTAAR